jgi:hypothetical protein
MDFNKNIGDIVYHKNFGKGKVTKIDRDGDSLSIEVSFEEAGKRKSSGLGVIPKTAQFRGVDFQSFFSDTKAKTKSLSGEISKNRVVDTTSYKGYSFEKLPESDLKAIQEAVRTGVIKGVEDLKKMLPAGRTIPLEYLKLLEGKSPTGERLHEYQESGKTAELYKDIFKGIKTISITQGSKILFGDDYADENQLNKYQEEINKKIAEVNKKIESADIKTRAILNDRKAELEESNRELQRQRKQAKDQYSAKGGTVFHSFVEMLALNKLPKLKEALYSGDKELAENLIRNYFSKGATAQTLIKDSSTNFSESDSEILDEFLSKIKDFVNVGGGSGSFATGLQNYVNFLKDNNITLTDAVEKSIGFVTNINDELVKFVGTVDALFSGYLLDLKTGSMHPNAIAWQVNMGNFIQTMLGGEPAKHLGAFNPGMYGKRAGYLPVEQIPLETMKKLIVQAAMGERTDIDLTKYVKGSVSTGVVKRRGEEKQATFINSKEMYTGGYGAEKPELQKDIDKLNREAKELVESIKTLKGDDLEHILNQIYSTKDYSQGGIESNKFYRHGYFWDLVRSMLPYDISTVLNYAMNEGAAIPATKGVGTKTYRIEQGEDEPIAEIDVPTVLGISLKQWAKLANILSELPDGANKVKRLAELFEKEFKSFSVDEQRKVLSSFETLMTREENFNPEYIKLKKQQELLRAKIQKPESFGDVNVEELQKELDKTNEIVSEMEKSGELNFYQNFETAWTDVADEISWNNRELLQESMTDFKSVKIASEDARRGDREYMPDVFDLETDQDGQRYYSASEFETDPIKSATMTANRLGRILDYSARIDKAIEPMAQEMGVSVVDLAKTLLRDFAEQTGSSDSFNRYIRSKELAEDFKKQFPSFEGKITKDVSNWIYDRLDSTIKEEREALLGVTESQEAGEVTTYKIGPSGEMLDKHATKPYALLQNILGRRLYSTLYKSTDSIPIEVLDDLIKGKSLELTERVGADLPASSDHSKEAVKKREAQIRKIDEEAEEREKSWVEQFLNYDELLPEAQELLQNYINTYKEYKAAEKELSFYGGENTPEQKFEESDWSYKERLKDWEKVKRNFDEKKKQMEEVNENIKKTFPSGRVEGYSSEKMSEFLKRRAEEGIEQQRQKNIGYAALYSYRFSDKKKAELTPEEINEYLDYYSEQFGMTTDELLNLYRQENVYMGFNDFLKKIAQGQDKRLVYFSPKKIKAATIKGAADGVTRGVTNTVENIDQKSVEENVAKAVSDSINIGEVEPKEARKILRDPETNTPINSDGTINEEQWLKELDESLQRYPVELENEYFKRLFKDSPDDYVRFEKEVKRTKKDGRRNRTDLRKFFKSGNCGDFDYKDLQHDLYNIEMREELPDYLKTKEEISEEEHGVVIEGENKDTQKELIQTTKEEVQVKKQGIEQEKQIQEVLDDKTKETKKNVDVVEETGRVEKQNLELEKQVQEAKKKKVTAEKDVNTSLSSKTSMIPDNILKVQATSADISDLSRTKATSITTDYEGHTIGKTYKYLNDKVFADYGSGGLQAWIENAKQIGIDAAKAELIGILTKVPSYKKSSGGLSKAGRTAFDEIMTDAFGASYQPQQGLGAILSEVQGIHKDTSSIDAKMDYLSGGGGGAPSNKMEVSSDGGAGGGDEGGKKPPKSGGRKGKSDEEKAQADTEKRQKQDIREYQQYINRVISLESQIDKLQRQATLSGGKHKDAIYGTIDALNEELGDLNRNNDALKQRVATEQAATKESIDATAALRKQSNAQKNLVSVKGATSIWDMMANDIRRATMRVADFGIAAKILNKIPQDIQKVIQYTKELDAAMTNIRVVTGATAEEAQTLAQGYTQLAKELGITTVEVANSANEWVNKCLAHYKLL